MLKILLSSIIVLLLPFNSFIVVANSAKYDNCKELLNKKVQEDIFSSFPEIKEVMEKDKGFRYHYLDLIKVNTLIGKNDSHINSLIELFSGTSIGNRHLLIVSEKYSKKWNNSFTGYIIYKEINGTNVLLKLKRGPMKWEVVEQSNKRGKYVTFGQIDEKCVRDH